MYPVLEFIDFDIKIITKKSNILLTNHDNHIIIFKIKKICKKNKIIFVSNYINNIKFLIILKSNYKSINIYKYNIVLQKLKTIYYNDIYPVNYTQNFQLKIDKYITIYNNKLPIYQNIYFFYK